ncbi:MAG: histidine--tRNA ligase [Cyanobacteria bacterium SIG26]|nr:histidine--tRNA ligase [Cyanobacteria bacterium SIG26]
MAEILKVLKGTKDILPQDINMWQFVEKKANEIFSTYGFKEIRTPIIEVTELFSRGVGDTTDIVNKEMYTFDKSDRSITLRPENTAGVVRSYIENGMSRLSAPVKLWYKGPMFRYERPQAGRQRQFHQVGVEMFGIKQATADAEVILAAVSFLKSLGLNDLDVEINSLGCPVCREDFKNRLKAVLKPYFEELCDDCKNRYEKNPLRLLDCKVDSCKKIFEKPEIQQVINSDFICDECNNHYTELKLYLDKMGIKYCENKLLVRGLDYYNRTVFEIKSNNLGSQNAVCGGGRYDNLVAQLGGEPTPAVGFAMGMERLISLMEKQESKKLDGYIVSNYTVDALIFAEELRNQGLSVEFDLTNKKFTKQLEKASKVAKYAFILGEDEVSNNQVSIKNLEQGTQIKVDRANCVKMLEL